MPRPSTTKSRTRPTTCSPSSSSRRAPKAAAATSSVYNQNREYTGDRLTLNFQDLETRAVLQLIADFSGQNIVVSDTVMGSVTLRLQNVPWDQALDIVMTTKGLDMRRNGNVIIVAPPGITAREQADLRHRKRCRRSSRSAPSSSR